MKMPACEYFNSNLFTLAAAQNCDSMLQYAYLRHRHHIRMLLTTDRAAQGLPLAEKLR